MKGKETFHSFVSCFVSNILVMFRFLTNLFSLIIIMEGYIKQGRGPCVRPCLREPCRQEQNNVRVTIVDHHNSPPFQLTGDGRKGRRAHVHLCMSLYMNISHIHHKPRPVSMTLTLQGRAASSSAPPSWFECMTSCKTSINFFMHHNHMHNSWS
jgi:hypothetical protein